MKEVSQVKNECYCCLEMSEVGQNEERKKESLNKNA